MLVSRGMIAQQREKSWSTLLTSASRHKGKLCRWALSKGVSNLAQNNQRWRVIFSWAEMAEKNLPPIIAPSQFAWRDHACIGNKNKGELAMDPVLYRFRDRFRRRRATVKALVSKWFASLTPPVQGYASQRMCPFCGLITPRAKTSCLECGKSLAPAT